MKDYKHLKQSMTEDSIEALTQAMLGEATEQDRRVFREALRGLIAVAKTELREMRMAKALEIGNGEPKEEAA